MSEDYNPLGVPKGCELRIRADRSSYYQPKFEPPPKTQFLIAREVAKPAPERVVSPSGVERERLEAAQKFRADHLLKMGEVSKGLTANSGLSDEAVNCWRDGIQELIKSVAMYL